MGEIRRGGRSRFRQSKRDLSSAARTFNWRWRLSDGGYYYENSTWFNPLFLGGYNTETPPPRVSADGVITPYPPTGARTLNVRTVIFFGYTFITPAMIMRLTDIGSQYLIQAVDSKGEYFDDNKAYKVKLPPNIPAGKFWSFTVYDNQTRSMLATPQRYPRAGSQSYPSPAAEPNADGSISVYFAPTKPEGVSDGNWIQTDPKKGSFTILRLYSPLEPFFTKSWKPGEIEAVSESLAAVWTPNRRLQRTVFTQTLGQFCMGGNKVLLCNSARRPPPTITARSPP